MRVIFPGRVLTLLKTEPSYLRNICDSVTSLLRIFVGHFPRLGTCASRRREDLHGVAIGGAARNFHASPLRPLASRYSK